MSQTKLLSKKAKKIEREIVNFYKTVGEMVDLNPKATEIFAYLKIHDTLTQEQLKQLTGFSLGTISSILQLFLQTEIVNRQFISGTHKNIYSIRPEKINFVYTPSTQILEDLERLDTYIVEKQSDLQKLQSTYPIEVAFLQRRLNSLRNYIEVQRRQISREKRYSFFQEDTSEIIPLNEMIVYPFDTQELEERFMDILIYYKDNPIKDGILRIFYTHRSADQKTLMDISGFSRSTISRFLQKSLRRGFIHSLPREHRKPRIYYLNSISSSILTTILNTDNFIFTYASRFQEILSTLESEKWPDKEKREVSSLMDKVKEILNQINTFKKNTQFLRDAYQELVDFLKNNTPISEYPN